MDDEQIQRIDAEIKRLNLRKQALDKAANKDAFSQDALKRSKMFIDGMIHALEWGRSNL